MSGQPPIPSNARRGSIDRSPWRLDPEISFLNHGSFGACPEPVLAAQRAWRDRMEQEPVRFLARELEGLLDDARREVAAFVGGDPEGLAFVPNATTGVSAVLGSLRFEPGDELLATDHEYNATLNALRLAAARDGATVVLAHIPFPIRDPSEALDAILAAVTPRTRLALVSHVTSITALVLPIAAIVAELDRRGVDTLVDAAHAPGMVPLDLDALGAAFWTGNGHKWLCGPKGAAMLHVRSDRRDRIRPLVVSHGENDPRDERSRFRRRWDWLGTGDPTPYLTLPDALRFVASLDPDGWHGVMTANATRARIGREALMTALEVPLPAPDAMLGAMASVPLAWVADDAASMALQRSLVDEEGIEVAIGRWPVPAARDAGSGGRTTVVRISAQRYVRSDEFERLAAVLASRRPPVS
jgi:isopenicillin-N epimerase